jgi:hypothetical protein
MDWEQPLPSLNKKGVKMKCLMERLHALYFTTYSKEDKYVPSEFANLDADYHTYIKDSIYL